jgi:hypothetical protein
MLEIELDLQAGLEAAEQMLDEVRPLSVRICYGQHPVGYIPLQPGYERLRGIHLKPILATTLAVPLLQALALSSTANAPPIKENQSMQFAIQSWEHANAN